MPQEIEKGKLKKLFMLQFTTFHATGSQQAIVEKVVKGCEL